MYVCWIQNMFTTMLNKYVYIWFLHTFYRKVHLVKLRRRKKQPERYLLILIRLHLFFYMKFINLLVTHASFLTFTFYVNLYQYKNGQWTDEKWTQFSSRTCTSPWYLLKIMKILMCKLFLYSIKPWDVNCSGKNRETYSY